MSITSIVISPAISGIVNLASQAMSGTSSISLVMSGASSISLPMSGISSISLAMSSMCPVMSGIASISLEMSSISPVWPCQVHQEILVDMSCISSISLVM